MTPLESYSELATAIDVSQLLFKREDLHPYGSHKGRSIPVMIDEYYAQGDRSFAISSSGNAALAAAIHIQNRNMQVAEADSDDFLTLDIFVGNHIAPHKEEKLERYIDEHIRVLKKERPLQALNQAVHEGARSLRQSTDDVALKGYTSLAEELAAIPDLGAIFIGTSSGTTAQALAQYFLNHPSKGSHPVPQIHIVQTASCHPIADAFNSYDGPEEISEADAITDITAFRKTALVPLIEQTGGSGWFATNESIETALILTKKHTDLDISPNSALSVAGVMQAVYAGHTLSGAVVCLICGE